jgi:cysteinyl-tRNA synthetase
MPIRFYNTLTHSVQSFEPINAPNVSMYNCGPTVYDYAHIGNFRSFMFADVLRRFLELAGYNVHQVMNITDVGHMTEDQLADGGGEDKMVLAARRMKEAKKSGKADVADPDDPYQIAAFFTDAFIEDARLLGLKVADEYPQQMPRATEHVEHMQQMITTLIEKDHAYVASDGAVYYSVESFPEYGKLSGNSLDKLRGGAGGRISDAHQAGKRHPADFLLWKPDATHVMKWDSPWGSGYPGWHIECSAMAKALLGRDVIDIHTGGEDNIFPHHECEIAQTCGATGESSFARFWMHARYLLFEGEKMSKSKGTFFTVRGLLAKGIDPRVLRYELIKANYRTNINFTMKGLQDSASAVQRLNNFAATLGDTAAEVDGSHPPVAEFVAALSDDLNISAALAVVFKWLDGDHSDKAQSLGVLRQFDRVLGVLGTNEDSHDDADRLCEQLDAARAGKDYDQADRIRQELIDAGYEVLTTKERTKARKKLA